MAPIRKNIDQALINKLNIAIQYYRRFFCSQQAAIWNLKASYSNEITELVSNIEELEANIDELQACNFELQANVEMFRQKLIEQEAIISFYRLYGNNNQ